VEKLGYTKRQITYDIQKVNDWLQEQQFPPIVKTPNHGLMVDETYRSQILDSLPKINIDVYIPSQEERLKLIYLQLFIKQEFISVNHITALLKMSRNTVITYIQLLKEELLNDNIILTYNRGQGYNLNGNELTIRSIAFKYISNILKLPNGMRLLEEIYISQMQVNDFEVSYKVIFKKINTIEKQLKTSFVEDQIRELALFFIFLKLRVQFGITCRIDEDTRFIIKDSDIFHYSREIISTLQIPANEDECAYISMYFLGLNIYYEPSEFKPPIKNKELLAVIQEILNKFEKYACVKFSNRENLVNSLYMHIKPVYYRNLFNINLTNPFLDKIKQEYHELYILVKRAISPLEKYLESSLSEDEIGYITLHFGGYLKKENLTFRRRRCVIICPNGVATSNMLKKQIDQIIPEIEVVKVLTPRQFKEEMDIDLVISTISIKTRKPNIIVSPILTSIDKARIIKEVNYLLYNKGTNLPKVTDLLNVIRKYSDINDEQQLINELTNLLTVSTVKELGRVKPVLRQLLTREMIQIKKKADTWEDAIRIASAPLLKQKKIEKRYIDAMIENIKKIGPYIVLTPKVAIPHARPEDGVNEIGMSLLKLNKPVSFSRGDRTKDVSLIVIIAAIDNELHLKALSQLSTMLDDESTVDQLIGESTVDGILQYIYRYSNEKGGE
jgi:transcriptional antiterminator/mannitol/fructose-specific phosphotransferase system IIA component (Ntr-type)